jgi:hypothetical protein
MDFILPPQYMKFNSSWDWLMPIRNKIHSLGGYIILAKNLVTVQYVFAARTIQFEEDSQLESVYKAVIDFIKWYNENQLKT